jgi:hypothetical protein
MFIIVYKCLWFELSTMAEEVCTPRQLVIMKDPSSIPTAVAIAGLTLPLGNLFEPCKYHFFG